MVLCSTVPNVDKENQCSSRSHNCDAAYVCTMAAEQTPDSAGIYSSKEHSMQTLLAEADAHGSGIPLRLAWRNSVLDRC